MARGNDPGRDFDDQWNKSHQSGQKKAARGEMPWDADKYRENLNNQPMRQPGPKHAATKNEEGCGKATVMLLGLLGGLTWLGAEAVQYIV